MQQLLDFLNTSYTAYHAIQNAESLLKANGFSLLKEQEPWALNQGGKYYVKRNGSALIAFTLSKDNSYFKIVVSHTDSPALKLKQDTLVQKDGYQTLSVEVYGGGIWYSFFDRPLRIAGRVLVETENGAKEEVVLSSYQVTIPSVAIHQNRKVNDKFAIDQQVDLQPLLSLSEGEDYLSSLSDGKILSYDLYCVNAQSAYAFGVNDEFIAAPRVDNLTSVYSSLTSLLKSEQNCGINVVAAFDNEEVGSHTYQGAGSDFLQTTLRRISLALNKTESEHLQALSASFMVSLDNAHAVHPNHPEKSDPYAKTKMGNGIVIKTTAKKAYVTDGLSSAIINRIFDLANVPHQTFFNRSGALGGSTLGAISLSQVGVLSVDIGLAQLAMHSSVECFAKKDYLSLFDGLTAFYNSAIRFDENSFTVR